MPTTLGVNFRGANVLGGGGGGGLKPWRNKVEKFAGRIR